VVTEPVSLVDLLRPGLEANPDAPAVVSADTHWTWRELDDRTDRVAAGLLALGLAPGDRVASLMPNRPALLVFYIACFKAGLVATPLNYRYMAPEIDHALSVSGARALLVHAEREADLSASELAGRLPVGLIKYEAHDGRGPTFESLASSEPSPPAPAEPSSPAAIAVRAVVLALDVDAVAGSAFLVESHPGKVEGLEGAVLQLDPTMVERLTRLRIQLVAVVRDRESTGRVQPSRHIRRTKLPHAMQLLCDVSGLQHG